MFIGAHRRSIPKRAPVGKVAIALSGGLPTVAMMTEAGETPTDKIRPPFEVSLTPALSSLAKDMLEPSAKLVGKELREFLKKAIEAKKSQKQAENLEHHVKAVRARQSSQPAPETTLRQLEFFETWTEGVQNVSPDDQELGRIWQNLMVHTLGDNEPPKLDLLRALRAMDSQMASLLFRISEGRFPGIFRGKAVTNTEEHVVRKLVELGLVETNWLLPLLAFARVLVIGTLAGGLVFQAVLWFMTRGAPSDPVAVAAFAQSVSSMIPSAWMSWALTLFVVVTLLVIAFAILLFMKMPYYVPTRFGYSLLIHSPAFQDSPEVQKAVSKAVRHSGTEALH